MNRYIDLSHPLYDRMPVRPGLPPPRITADCLATASHSGDADPAGLITNRYEMTGTIATHLDSPRHRHPDRMDLARLPLDAVAGLRAMVLRSIGPHRHAVNVPFHDSQARGAAILIETGWDQKWGTDAYWEPGPFLSEDLVFRLVRAGAALVGVDFWDVDDVDSSGQPAHTDLLANDILIVKNLCNLAALPRVGFRFSAVPAAVEGGASFPVRAFAEIGD